MPAPAAAVVFQPSWETREPSPARIRSSWFLSPQSPRSNVWGALGPNGRDGPRAVDALARSERVTANVPMLGTEPVAASDERTNP